MSKVEQKGSTPTAAEGSEGPAILAGYLLDAINNAFQAGEEVDWNLLREAVTRCEVFGLRARVDEFKQHWPDWTKECVSQGIVVASTHGTGDNETCKSPFMEWNQNAPDADILPLEAWTVFHMWLYSGGVRSGTNLPEWVWHYLISTAQKVYALRLDEKLPPPEKVAALPRALGFAGTRRNVFADADRHFKAEVAAWIDESVGRKGVTGDDRRQAVREAFEIKDERTARRLIAKGRKAIRPRRPWSA